MPFRPHVTCPSSLESTLVSAFERVLIPFPIQPIGPSLSWEWTAAMIFFTFSVWLSPDSLLLPAGITSLHLESETLVQSSLLPAANDSASDFALLSVPREVTNRRQFQ